MTTERDLIQRLTKNLDHLNRLYNVPDQSALVEEFLDFLSQPEPEDPTDEELLCIAAEAIDGYGNCGIKPGEYEEVTEQAVEAYGSELIAYARAILARWGNHPANPDSSLQPIPVSERMPGPEDCNSEGKAMRPQQQQENN